MNSISDLIGLMTKDDAMEQMNRNNAPNRKPVVRIDSKREMLMVYPSIQAAADDNNISRSAISRRCGNKIGNPLLLRDYSFKYLIWLEELTDLLDGEKQEC